jgi:hypothetical protein
MAFLLFLGALLGIVAVAVIVNRVTGTRAKYLEDLELQAGETERWRDVEADFATLPRTGGALVTSHVRLRRHAVVWTDRRVIIAQKALFSKKRMISHQLVFAEPEQAPASDAERAAKQFLGGFYGRGFSTILCSAASLDRVGGKECVRVVPDERSGFAMNIRQMLIFTDRAAELKARLPEGLV